MLCIGKIKKCPPKRAQANEVLSYHFQSFDAILADVFIIAWYEVVL